MANQAEKQPWHPSSKWLSIFLITISVVYIVSLYEINVRFERQYNFNKEIKSEPTHVNNPIIELKPDTASKKFYLNEKDISELNNHVEYLTNKLETEVDRNQRNAEFNIDRLNLFMALGIGFLALIGGLLPLAINFISKHDIESKMEGIQIRLDKSNRILKTSEDKMPIIDMLILQNVVSKLTSQDAWKLFGSRAKPDKIIPYFDNIRLSLEAFNDNSHSFEDYNEGNLSYFKNTISELKGALLSGPIRNINGNKDLQKCIDKLILDLHFFEVNDAMKFKTHLTVITSSITELKILIEKKII